MFSMFRRWEKAFEGVTHVYHCAAIVSYVKKDRGRMMENNVQGTANMVNLALGYGGEEVLPGFIYCGNRQDGKGKGDHRE